MARRKTPRRTAGARKRAPKVAPKVAPRAAPRAASRAPSRGARQRAATGAAPEVRLPRIAKGKKPQYFSDPAIDKLLWMTLTLMEELSVARDRIDTLERLLDDRGLLRQGDVDGFVPGPAARAQRAARRAGFVDRMMRAAQAELGTAASASDPHEEASSWGSDAEAAVPSSAWAARIIRSTKPARRAARWARAAGPGTNPSTSP